MYAGRCLCERIQYQISGAIGPVYHCHCSKCRRWHGAAFRSRASVKRTQFQWVSGRNLCSTYKSSENVTKYFCQICGTPLISTYSDRPDVLGLPIGALEGLQEAGEQAHIFVKDKAHWYDITDGRPQFDAWPGTESAVRQTAELE